MSEFTRFGSAIQHLDGARSALPRVAALLSSDFPGHTVEIKQTDGLAYLLITGPSLKIVVFAGAYCDFTAYDVYSAEEPIELFSSSPDEHAKDRRIKSLRWSIEELRMAMEILVLKS